MNDSYTEEVISNYGGKEFSQFKNDLGELASSKLSPISAPPIFTSFVSEGKPGAPVNVKLGTGVLSKVVISVEDVLLQ